jgi:hypothetical protein
MRILAYTDDTVTDASSTCNTDHREHSAERLLEKADATG